VLLLIQREAAVAAFAHIFPPERFPFPDAAVREDWLTALGDPQVEVFVAELEGNAIGSVAGGAGWLRTLYVLPRHWGGGTGAALHDHGLERLRRAGDTEVKLWTLEGNAAGRRFYEQRGWIETGQTRVLPFPPQPLDVEYRRPLQTA